MPALPPPLPSAPPPVPPASPSPPPPPPVAPAVRAFAVRFTGQGGEYFRVWIVNVLLMLATLGLYTPFARYRAIRYFYGHTQVAGSPLEFSVRRPWRMFAGFVLMLALYAAFEAAEQFGFPLLAGLLLLGFAVALPFLWGSAMRFRLGCTRWRGVRLSFRATWGEVYKASWPLLLMVVALLVLTSVVAFVEDGQAMPAAHAAPVPVHEALAISILSLLLMLGGWVAMVRLEYNYCVLRVRRAFVGNQPGRLQLPFGELLVMYVQMGLVGALGMCVAWVLFGVVMAVFVASKSQMDMNHFVAFIMLMAVVMMLVTAPARAFRTARLFQLVWNNAGLSRMARSKTSLKTGAYMRLCFRNLLLTVITLGYYRPWAVASEYAARVNSVTLYARGELDQITGDMARQQGAFGDAVADMLGLDLI